MKRFSRAFRMNEMLYRSGRIVVVGWLLTRWRALYRPARKVGVYSLIALVLLPACSTADDFHTCTLHRLSFIRRSVQFSPAVSSDQLDPTECLACQWQVVSDAIPVVRSCRIELQLLHSLTIELDNPPLVHTHTSWQNRAPPVMLSPFYSA